MGVIWTAVLSARLTWVAVKVWLVGSLTRVEP